MRAYVRVCVCVFVLTTEEEPLNPFPKPEQLLGDTVWPSIPFSPVFTGVYVCTVDLCTLPPMPILIHGPLQQARAQGQQTSCTKIGAASLHRVGIRHAHNAPTKRPMKRAVFDE